MTTLAAAEGGGLAYQLIQVSRGRVPTAPGH
jgi:hypothetical protein